MIQEQPLLKRQARRNQRWLVMVTDRELLHRVWAMQAIREFHILKISDVFEMVYWTNAVERGSRSGIIPDVALIEWRPNMPAVANEEFLERVRHIPALAHLPVIVLCTSELGDADKAELCERYGVNSVVSKPLPRLYELDGLIAETRQKMHFSRYKTDSSADAD